jgi:uncharacterized protein (TIGR02246 family)
MRLYLSLTLPVLALLAGCAAPAPPAAPVHDEAADMAAINGVRSAFADAFNAGDVARLATLYAADAIVMPANEPALTGIEAITKRNTDTFTSATMNITITPQETKVMGDWAFDRGEYSMAITPKAANAKPMTDSGKYLVLLQRQADGSWKLARDIDNSNTPMPGLAMPAGAMKQ